MIDERYFLDTNILGHQPVCLTAVGQLPTGCW